MYSVGRTSPSQVSFARPQAIGAGTRFGVQYGVPYSVGSLGVAWAKDGAAIALDEAAATILHCFDEPVTPRELAADLAEAVGLGSDVALRSVCVLAASLGTSGHLIPFGIEPRPAQHLAYPPSASP